MEAERGTREIIVPRVDLSHMGPNRILPYTFVDNSVKIKEVGRNSQLIITLHNSNNEPIEIYPTYSTWCNTELLKRTHIQLKLEIDSENNIQIIECRERVTSYASFLIRIQLSQNDTIVKAKYRKEIIQFDIL